MLYSKKTIADDMKDTSVINYVCKILQEAITKSASDIHLEPYEKEFRIRYRIDGLLYEMTSLPLAFANRISARIKIMAKLDIAERRIPQDGRFKMQLLEKREVDFRVSTCPMIHGEKIVVRILDTDTAALTADALGFDEQQKEIFLQEIHKPQGMILVTGPTGSGKTISLYTALKILNTPLVNIATVEDPIEVNMPGINQVNINNKAGLGFARVLRAFLRQDPDIIMVGEMRDLETAEIAIKAAQTGHKVLSTLHTNSAPETLTRLVNMGVPRYNIAASISLILAQRLARKLCADCKIEIKIPPEELLRQGFKKAELTHLQIFAPVGCNHCSNGYKGRSGIFELLPVTEKCGDLIMRGAEGFELMREARLYGMQTLRESGLNKVKAGITSLQEVNRVTQD